MTACADDQIDQAEPKAPLTPPSDPPNVAIWSGEERRTGWDRRQVERNRRDRRQA